MAFYQRLNPRLFVLSGVTALLFLILMLGLAWQQLWKSSEYERLERRQSLRRILQPGPRGRILDRNGVPLVVNQPHYSVVLYVDELRKDVNLVYNDLQARDKTGRNDLYRQARLIVAHRFLDQANALLGLATPLDEKGFIAHVEQKPLLPYTLMADLTPQQYALFNEKTPIESPMQTRVEARRYYPYGSLAFHTLGWVGLTNEFDEEDWPVEDMPKYSTFPYRGMTGLSGLELLNDDTLSGKSGGEIWMVDPANARVQRIAEKVPEAGQDITCSLDVNLQLAAEKAMDEHVAHAPCSAVALDVRTGEVLVLASKPDFDLNRTSPNFTSALAADLESSGGWLCRPLQGAYPPGSTFKLITTIAAMRHGVLDGNTLLNCPGYIMIGGKPKRDDTYDIRPEGYGNIDVITALEKSNDVFYYQVGLMMHWQDLNAEALRFGLGQKTNVGLPEAPLREMIVPDPATKKRLHNEGWDLGDNANFAVGQGDLLVTPMQMACVAASIARDETRTQPTLVHNPARSPGTVIHQGEPIGLPGNLRQVLLIGMEKVVSDDGTGKFAQIPGIRIAGKTGTAQWGPHKNTTVAWFVCFAPAEDPRIAIAVAVESPREGADIYGGRTAVPVAHDILVQYFKDHPIDQMASLAK